MDEVLLTIKGISFTWEGIGITVAAAFSVLSVVGNAIQYFRKKKELKEKNSIEYITNKRVDWIYAVRKEAANYLALAHTISGQKMIKDEDIYKISESLYQVELFLNYNGVVDNVLISLMYRIIEAAKTQNPEYVNIYAQQFCNHMRIYLKVEWDRVKIEAQGGEYDKKRNLRELISAYDKYENRNKCSDIISMEKTKKLLEKQLKTE